MGKYSFSGHESFFCKPLWLKKAYDAMIASDNPVKGVKIFEWKKLSNNKRVKMHLQVLAESLGGKLEAFKILED